MDLILIRHGQIPSNETGALDTAVPGPSLTTLGVEQAAAIPGALGRLDGLGDLVVEAVFASDLIRTSETALPLAKSLNLDISVDPGFAEVNAGDLEMHSDTDSRDIYLKTAWGWANGDLSPRIPGGEDGFEAMGRFTDAIARAYASGADAAAVFSHGTVTRVWSSLAIEQGGGEPMMVQQRLDNTGAVFLRGEPDHWELINWHTLPLGGAHLVPKRRNDPTGQGTATA